MTATFDVIVIGVGAMGAMACSALARRGARVLGLEQFDVPHGLGSSGGQSRLIRKAYFEHPDYVPLLHAAYAGWDALGERSGVQLLFRTGLVHAGPRDGVVVQGATASARQHGLAVECLTPDAARGRWPQLAVPEAFDVLFEADAGFVLAERAIGVAADEAMRHGASLRARERVTSWRVDGGGVEVTTARGRYRAARLVLTAGAWAAAMVAQLGVPLVVTRQVIAWFAPRTPRAFAHGSFPCWAIEDDRPDVGGLFYGFPSLGGAIDGPRGAKAGHHRRGAVADPDRIDRTPHSDEVDAIRGGLRRFVPELDGLLLAAHVCMYTSTPDEHFVVDVHPEHPQVAVACGFSGHGFKFAPAVGDALADLALAGATALPIGFLGTRAPGRGG